MAHTLKVITQGKSTQPALVFFHAFPFTAEMWKDQLNLFAEKYYCIAPHLSGFDESALPDYAVTFEHHVDSVLSYLKEAKVEKAIWCGLSMGGYLALRLYERAPELCRALILCDTKASPDGNEAKLKRWATIQLLQKSRKEFVEAQWDALIGASSKTNAPLKKQFENLISKVSSKGVSSGLVALATRTDSQPNLQNIRIPTLIVVGEEDKVTPPQESESMSKSIAGSQLKVLTHTGHLSNLENPQKFNELLSEFLTGL